MQAFVNTREAERGWEALSGPNALREWLSRRALLGKGESIGGDDVRRARELREALRGMLAANNGGAVGERDVETLNRAAGRARLEVRFGTDGRAAVGPVSGGTDAALGRILAAVQSGMQEGTWDRLKACANEHCTWAFYDRSKNRSGEWCSMAVCGNRTKTRAYRRRRAETH